MTNRKKLTPFTIWLALALTLFPLSLSAQEINLDKLEKCADLLCYQSLKEPNVFYYLPDRPRIAYKDGRPQFSFLKYARVKETGEAGTGRAGGGGIVHFLVTYGADEGRVRSAERSLQEQYPDARIAGPIVYRKGSFALITSFQEGNRTTTRTVAVGKAPLMEGQKAAVSMALTREGAELLWESFQTSTPDISLVFDMRFSGVREPYEATIEADWSRVAKSHRIQAGVKYAMFGADVDLLFQELRQSGAIKIITKGENKMMDKIVESANAKLLKVMFDPAPPDELTRAAAESTKSSYENLDMAAKLLKDAVTKRRSSGRRSAFLNSNKPEDHTKETGRQWLTILLDRLNHTNWFIGSARADNGQLDKAVEGASQAWKAAVKAYEEEDYNKALDLFQRAFDLNELIIDEELKRKARKLNLYNTAQTLRKLSRYEEALNYYEKTLGHTRETDKKLISDSYLYSGHCLNKLKRHAEAVISFGKAIASHDYEDADPDHLKQIEQLQKESTASAYNLARRLDERARASGYNRDECHYALEAWLAYQDNVIPSGERAKEAESRVKFLENKLEKIGVDKVTGKGSAAGSTQGVPILEKKKAAGSPPKSAYFGKGNVSPSSSSGGKPLTRASSSSRSSGAKSPSRQPSKSKSRATAATSRSDGMPGFSLVASYRLKRIKRSGTFRYSMRNYRTEIQAFAMAENIGDLFSRYGNDTKVFRAVTIDDPVFKQREVLVTLDGQDTDTFSRHLNFVTVQMEKKHQSGELTTDEVVITPENFNSSGNSYSLSYGWKGDDDRRRWLDYKVKTLWSFHGGVEISGPWSKKDRSMLSLEPPHRYRSITIEGDGERLSSEGVRHAVITITSEIGDKPVMNQVTIRNQGPAPSMMLEVPENRNGPPGHVEIIWYLEGGKKLSAPLKLLEGDILYWDNLPSGR